jgi:hypothetical protein
MTCERMPQNGKMWKDKWTELNSNFKKMFGYHKSTDHNNVIKVYLLKSLINLIYLGNLIKSSIKQTKVLQGDQIMDVPLHVQDL